MSSESKYTTRSIQSAVRELVGSETGRQALHEQFPFLDGAAASIDMENRAACCLLHNAFWHGMPATVLEELRRVHADEMS